jgi:polysaccharide biosynthesis/export protein
VRWSGLLAAALFAWLVALGPIWGQESAARDSSYRIGVGDVLRVDAFTHPEISGRFPVEGNGEITFPLLGEVPVAGKTTAEVVQLLVERLEKDYYVEIQLVAEVEEYRSQPVTVLGEVLKPGTYYLQGHTSLTQILVEAGGLHQGAGPELELRRVVYTQAGESQEVQTFPIDEVLGGGEGSEIELRPGDVIKVSAKQVYFITGEVASPGQYESVRGLTLMQAVSQAGGLGKFASQMVEVHRDAEGKRDIQTFDLSKIRRGKVDDPPVHQGDVIIVRRRFL